MVPPNAPNGGSKDTPKLTSEVAFEVSRPLTKISTLDFFMRGWDFSASNLMVVGELAVNC